MPAAPPPARRLSSSAITTRSPGALPRPAAMSRICSSKAQSRQPRPLSDLRRPAGRYDHPRGDDRGARRRPGADHPQHAPRPCIVRCPAMLPATAGDRYVLALAAPFLGADDRSADALWGIDRAADWNGFRTALQSFVGPQQNMVRWRRRRHDPASPERNPIRKAGNAWLPVPGWTGEYDWTGYIPFAELPQATNPAAGASSAPTTRSCPTITAISCRATGTCRTAPRASASCSTPRRSNLRRRAPRSRPTRCRSRRAGWCR